MPVMTAPKNHSQRACCRVRLVPHGWTAAVSRAAEVVLRSFRVCQDQARAVFRRAIERGEIPGNTNIEVALDLLNGPLYHRLLHGNAPIKDRFTRDVIDMALGGIQPAASPKRTS